ncbi:MAG TPA: VWA domain-containing protein [Thermoanaerobaculia bacterium]
MRTLAAIMAALTASALLAQQPAKTEPQSPFSEKIEVNEVLLDTIVTDSRGNQILGLDKNDFVVTENGAPQKLDGVDYYTSRRLLDSPEASAPFRVEQVHDERYLIFFFDKPEDNQLFGRLSAARREVNNFLDRSMTDGDKVAIVGHDVRLKVYTDFTSDRAQLRQALEDVGRFSKGLTKPASDAKSASILKNIDLNSMMYKTGTVYEALTELADAVRPIHARKNLVLISPGIYEPGELVRNGIALNRSRHYDPMIEALNGADVSVYAINLWEQPPDAPVFHQTLEGLAQETNGDYFRNAVSFANPLKQVAKASAGYYLLSYRTEKKGRGFQKVQVSIRDHPELRVAARAGYTYGD